MYKLAPRISLLAGALLLAAACGRMDGIPLSGPGTDGRSAEAGAMEGITTETSGFALHVEMPLDADVDGFDVSVRRVACHPGEPVPHFEAMEHVGLSGDFVPGGSAELINNPFDVDSAHPAADRFFLVEAGCYEVAVNPVTAQGWASADCMAATARGVAVHDGSTTEITVVVQCSGGAPTAGGLDVIVGVNRPPHLKHVEYRPSKLTPACEPVTLCACALDDDLDPIDIEWVHTLGDDFTTGPDVALLEGGPGEVNSCVHLVPAGPGYHVITVTAMDMAWLNGQLVSMEALLAAQGDPQPSRATIDLPLHVGPSRHGGYDCDSPPPVPEPCDECDGKVTDLELRWHGRNAAQIEVLTKRGDDLLFSGTVAPGGTFRFVGVDRNGTMGTEIAIWVNGREDVAIHTSCSRPIGIGMEFGDFEVVDGASRRGGPFCASRPPAWPSA